METNPERGGAQAGALYVSVKEDFLPDGFALEGARRWKELEMIPIWA